MTFDVPGIVANKGVYAAVFGNATTTSSQSVTSSSVGPTLTVQDTSFFPSSDTITLNDGTNSLTVTYTSIQDGTTLAGVQIEGTPPVMPVTVNSGATVSLGSFVYLASASAASTTTLSTMTTSSVGPVNGNPIAVGSVTGFPTQGSILVSLPGLSQVVAYTGLDTVNNTFTGTTFQPGASGIAIDSSVTLLNVLDSTISVESTVGFTDSGALMLESPPGYAPNENVVVYYTGKTATSFTGVTGIPPGTTLPSGGAVIQMADPTTATEYAVAPVNQNLPLINLFPTTGGPYANTNALVTATLNLPDPSINGVLSGVIVISVGTPIALPVTGTSGSPIIGSPTPQTNPDDVFGLFEWGLTSDSLDFDVSEVDQVGFPFQVTSVGTSPPPPADPVLGVGLLQDRDTLFNGFRPYINSLDAASDAGVFLAGAPDNANAPFDTGTRITAPQDIIGILQGNPPVGSSAMPTGPAGTYTSTTAYYAVTAINATGGIDGGPGESMASNVLTGVTGTASKQLQVTWKSYPYATGYNVYWSSSAPVDGQLVNPQLIGTTDGSTLSFTDTTPSSHTGKAQTPPDNNFLYDPLNRYYVPALKDFFDYYRTNLFVLDDQSTSTKWTGNTTDADVNGTTYTMLQLTGEAGQWGDLYSGETLNIYLPVFSSNTDQVPAHNGGITNFPAPPTWLTNVYSPWESPSSMVFGADGVFGSAIDAGTWSGASTLDVGNAKNVFNNIVSALTRGITPRRATGGGWENVLPPTNWAGSPLLTAATATTGGTLAPGSYRYSLTALNFVQSAALTGTVTGASSATPIVITSTAHGLQSGERVIIADVGGNTAANGTFTVTVLDNNTFSIPVASNGTYTSGGSWQQATETTPSNFIEVVVKTGENQVDLTWNALNLPGGATGSPTASGFNVYRSQLDATTGVWSDPAKLNDAPIENGPGTPTTTFSDDGTKTPDGAPPAVYFADGTSANFYAAYFGGADVSINGLAYGFPFADKNGQSTNVQMAVPDGLTILLNPWTSTTQLEIAVTPPAQISPSTPFQITVQAKEHSGSVDSNYGGTIYFESTDFTGLIQGTPISEFSYTFTPADQGTKVFTVLLNTVGAHALTVSDRANDLLVTAGVAVATVIVDVEPVGTPSPSILGQLGFAATVVIFDSARFQFELPSIRTTALPAPFAPTPAVSFSYFMGSLPQLPLEYRFPGGSLPLDESDQPDGATEEGTAEEKPGEEGSSKRRSSGEPSDDEDTTPSDSSNDRQPLNDEQQAENRRRRLDERASVKDLVEQHQVQSGRVQRWLKRMADQAVRPFTRPGG